MPGCAADFLHGLSLEPDKFLIRGRLGEFFLNQGRMNDANQIVQRAARCFHQRRHGFKLRRVRLRVQKPGNGLGGNA